MMDSRGCLSPILFVIEKNNRISIEDFATELMFELQKLDFSPERLFQLENQLKLSRIRGGFLREVKNVREFYGILSKNRSHLQCVALETSTAKRSQIASELSALGVNRICRTGQMQFPPLTWHHDGKFNLANWLTWTDLE